MKKIFFLSCACVGVMYFLADAGVPIPPELFATAAMVAFFSFLWMVARTSSKEGKKTNRGKGRDDSGHGSTPVIGGEDHRRSKSPFQDPNQW